MEDSDQNRSSPQPGGSGRDSRTGRDRGLGFDYSGGTEPGSDEGSVRFVYLVLL